jgi:hypothetical protein
MLSARSQRLSGIKEVKIEAITVGKHHDMCCSPDVGHDSTIVFHKIYLHECVKAKVVYP